jgi:hypothetical protein
MGAFLMVTAGRTEAGGRIDAPRVFEKLMLLHLSEGVWPHGPVGTNGHGLAPNDVVLFCLADEGGTQLVGDAVVAVRSTPLTPQRLGQVRTYLGPALPPDPQVFTHSSVLTQFNIWEQPRTCHADEPTGAEVLAALRDARRTGVVRPIGPPTFEAIVGRPVLDVPEGPPGETPQAEPAHAASDLRVVREFVRANWALVDFGEPLQPIEGTLGGGPLGTPAGPVDMLCEGADPRDLVAVMWADGEPASELVAAARRRVAWLRNTAADGIGRVRGLILTVDERPELATAEGDEIQVQRLRIRCEPVGRPKVYEPELLDVTGNFAATALSAPRTAREPVMESAAVGAGGNGGVRSGPAVDLDFAAKCLRVPRASGRL